MTHLDRERIEALLDGSLDPRSARALADHLRAPCPDCERAAEEHGASLDLLSRLCEAAEAAPQALSDGEREAIWGGVAPAQPTRWRRPATAATALFALAAALLLFLRPPAPGGLEKGGEVVAPAVELRVVAGRVEDGRFAAERRLADGARVGGDATLIFELETDRLAARYLFALDGSGRALQLLPRPGAVPAVEPAGGRQVWQGGDWVVLALDDLQGPLTLVSAASILPLDPQLEVLRPWQAEEPRERVGYATMTLELGP